MEKKIHFLHAGIACIVVIAFLAVATTACTPKKDDMNVTTTNESAKFVGTWHGTTTCDGAAGGGQTVITITGAGNAVSAPGIVGTTSCAKSVIATGNARGNTYTCNSQPATDNCGNPCTIGIDGNIADGTLTSMSTVSGGGNNTTCTFTGTK